jgi:hypothetical protein
MTTYIEDLDNVEARIRDLKEEIRRLEDQLARSQDYGDRRGGKRAHHASPMGYGSGTDLPLTQLTEERVSPATRPAPTYTSTVQAPPRIHVQRDVEMEDGEVGRYPRLPVAGWPYTPAPGAPTFPRGANWTAAPRGRPGMGMRGGRVPQCTARSDQLLITSMEELEFHLKRTETPGDERAVA